VNGAKHAVAVSMKLSIFLAALVLLVLGLGHDTWAGLFSSSPDILKSFASMTPLLCASIFLDSIQGVLSGSISSNLAWVESYLLIVDAMLFKLLYRCPNRGVHSIAQLTHHTNMYIF